MSDEGSGDVPGTDVPDPSLGVVPRTERPSRRTVFKPHRVSADRARGQRAGAGRHDPADLGQPEEEPGDGPVVALTLLASDPPRPPAGDVHDPEGVAFTAVSPFY